MEAKSSRKRNQGAGLASEIHRPGYCSVGSLSDLKASTPSERASERDLLGPNPSGSAH